MSVRKIEAIGVYREAHDRAMVFLSGGKDGKGKRASDDLRAAVVFAVAAIDAYCRVKIITTLRKKRLATKSFALPEAARDIVKQIKARDSFAKEFNRLPKKNQEIIDVYCGSNRESVMDALEKGLQTQSFQSLSQLDAAMNLMGYKSKEVWGRFRYRKKTVALGKRLGRPRKPLLGRIPDGRVQLERLFGRRHKIVHRADLNLNTKGPKGHPSKILYKDVSNWLHHAKSTIEKLDQITNGL